MAFDREGEYKCNPTFSTRFSHHSVLSLNMVTPPVLPHRRFTHYNPTMCTSVARVFCLGLISFVIYHNKNHVTDAVQFLFFVAGHANAPVLGILLSPQTPEPPPPRGTTQNPPQCVRLHYKTAGEERVRREANRVEITRGSRQFPEASPFPSEFEAGFQPRQFPLSEGSYEDRRQLPKVSSFL